jgi:hypothetical protein
MDKIKTLEEQNNPEKASVFPEEWAEAWKQLEERLNGRDLIF